MTRLPEDAGSGEVVRRKSNDRDIPESFTEYCTGYAAFLKR